MEITIPSFLDFLGQEGISNGWARRANQIKLTFLDHPCHRIGGSIAAHAHHRLGRDGFHEGGVGFLKSFFRET